MPLFSGMGRYYRLALDAMKELFIRVLMGVLIFLGYVLLSLFIYAIMRRIMVPQKLHVKPVHLYFKWALFITPRSANYWAWLQIVCRECKLVVPSPLLIQALAFHIYANDSLWAFVLQGWQDTWFTIYYYPHLLSLSLPVVLNVVVISIQWVGSCRAAPSLGQSFCSVEEKR